MYIFKKRRKKVKLINHDCLPILEPLCLVMYIMLASLMLLAALSDVVCLHNAFLPLILTNAICLHALSWFIYT